MPVSAATRQAVEIRAALRCEYCQLRQQAEPFFRFHVEHIVPRKHGGGDSLENLALSCHHCNRHKGPNLSGVDPTTKDVVPLFHPRSDSWSVHFQDREGVIIGLTAEGRASVVTLRMNEPVRVELRREPVA